MKTFDLSTEGKSLEEILADTVAWRLAQAREQARRYAAKEAPPELVETFAARMAEKLFRERSSVLAQAYRAKPENFSERLIASQNLPDGTPVLDG
jgi:hypothetical protein